MSCSNPLGFLWRGPTPQTRRTAQLAAYLVGQDDAATLAPELILAEKAAKRPPGSRIADKPTKISLLEKYSLPKGSASRYRTNTTGRPITMLIGWTEEDRVYLAR